MSTRDSREKRNEVYSALYNYMKFELTSRGSTSGGGTDGEHELVGTAILEETGEKSGPVRSNNVVTGSQKGGDVGSGDLSLAVVQSQGGKTGHKFVL